MDWTAQHPEEKGSITKVLSETSTPVASLDPQGHLGSVAEHKPWYHCLTGGDSFLVSALAIKDTAGDKASIGFTLYNRKNLRPTRTMMIGQESYRAIQMMKVTVCKKVSFIVAASVRTHVHLLSARGSRELNYLGSRQIADLAYSSLAVIGRDVFAPTKKMVKISITQD